MPAESPAGKRSLRRKLGFSILAVLLFLGGLILLDRIAGRLVPLETESLLFPSGRTIEHESCEFAVEVEISQAGIRDRDYAAGEPPAGTFRIAAVGDSFTFGWGVESDEAWPNVLERLLNEAAGRLENAPVYEVLNFGYPGASPDGYGESAELALEHFHPDLILVGTLQADDLIQLMEIAPPQSAWHEVLLDRLFPTTKRLLQGDRDSSEFISYRETFLKTQQYLRSQFTPAERDRYDALPYYVRECFENGQLNPSLVQRAITTPGHFQLPISEGEAWRKGAGERFEASLVKMAEAANHGECQMVVAVIPDGPYVSAASAQGMRMLGFDVPDELRVTHVPDEIVKAACERASVPCVIQTQRFREQDAELYFPLDGHFNRAGHELFAENLFLELKAHFGDLPGRD